MIFDHPTYQIYLASILDERKAKNSAYSLRAFARGLGVSQSTLSDVLRGRKQISLETANSFSSKLKLSLREKKYFRLLVQLQIEKDPEIQAHLESKLRVMNPSRNGTKPVDASVFKLISEWHFSAIMEMTHLHDVDMDVKTVAECLSISPKLALDSISQLVQLGLIVPIGLNRYKKTDSRYLQESNLPSSALRSFHAEMLKKAKESLTTQSPQEKFVGSETLPISRQDLPEAFTILESCFQQLIMLAERSIPRDEVYHVGIQMFRLTVGSK